MKNILLGVCSLLLTACADVPYCYYSPPVDNVVDWKPNPNINHLNYQYMGHYSYGCYYPPIGVGAYTGSKGWERGYNYPYAY